MLDKMKFKFILSVCFLLFHCHNSQENSFLKLSGAFFDWYYKVNPIEGSVKGIHLYDDLLPDFNKKSILKNLDDINRFLIEIDQIDYVKLSLENKANYFRLINQMEHIKFNYQVLMIHENSLLFYLNKIQESIEYIDYNNKNSFKNYISRLKSINKLLGQAKKNIKYKLSNTLNVDLVNNVLGELDQKYNYFLSKNIAIDTLNYYNNSTKKHFNDFKSWIEKEFIVDDFYVFESNVFNKKLSFLIQDDYIYNKKQVLADLNRLYTKMVKLSLPDFLLENDEPIWINNQDTLEVIKFSLLNHHDEVGMNYSDYLYNKIQLIKKQINNNHIFSINKLKESEIILKNNFKHSYKILNIDFPGSFDKNNKVYININNYYDNWSIEKQNFFKKKYSKINYDLIIMENFIPGEYLVNLYKSNNSIINKSFDNIVFTKGWRKYIQEVMIDNITDYDQNYKLFQYHHLVKSIINYIVDYELNTGVITKNEAIDFMINKGFYYRYEAERIIDEIIAYPGIFSLEYIGYKEIKDIERKYKKKNGKKFNLKVFNTELILNSNMRYSDLKDKLIN